MCPPKFISQNNLPKIDNLPDDLMNRSDFHNHSDTNNSMDNHVKSDCDMLNPSDVFVSTNYVANAANVATCDDNINYMSSFSSDNNY